MWYLIQGAILTAMLASGWSGSLATEPAPETVARLVHERHFERPPLEKIPIADLQRLGDYLHFLDPWSRLLSPEQGASVERGRDPYHHGIGVTYFDRAGGVFLVPLPDGPLSRGGVREPMHLVAADGIPATDARREEALARIVAGTGSIELMLDPPGNGQRRVL